MTRFIYYLFFSFSMKRESISVKLDPELWKEAKHHCLDKDITYSEYLEDLIKKDLKKK